MVVTADMVMVVMADMVTVATVMATTVVTEDIADMVMVATVITPTGTITTGTMVMAMARADGGVVVGTVMKSEPAGPGRPMGIGGFATEHRPRCARSPGFQTVGASFLEQANIKSTAPKLGSHPFHYAAWLWFELWSIMGGAKGCGGSYHG